MGKNVKKLDEQKKQLYDPALISNFLYDHFLAFCLFHFCVFLLAVIPAISFAVQFSKHADYSICFTPDRDCANEITKTILQAKHQILVQAYSFTDISIAKALVTVKKRGVEVKIILDKSQLKSKYTPINFLRKNGIKILIDSKPAIAHNKIIVIDRHIVLTGSYNFTHSAARYNAENLVIIKDEDFAQAYVKNWYTRERESTTIRKIMKKQYIKN